MRKLFVILLAAALLLTCGCNPFEKPPAEAPEKVVHLYAEPNIIPASVLESFSAQTGIRVKTYDLTDEDVMLGKLKTGVSPFDLLIGNNVMLERVAAEGKLLQTLDTAKLSNIGFFDTEAKAALPATAQDYLLPYTRTYAVLLHDVLKTQTPVTAYSSLWTPAFKDKINVAQNAHLMCAVALKSRGYSVNTKDAMQLKDAQDSLCALKENTYTHTSSTPGLDVAGGKGNLSVVWAKDAQAAYAGNQSLEVLYPREGCIMQTTCMAMPSTAPNAAYAYQLIDFLLQGESCAAVSAYTQTESLRTDIAAYADEAYAQSVAVRMATKENMGNEYLHYVANAETYNKIWDAFVQTPKTTQEVGQ